MFFFFPLNKKTVLWRLLRRFWGDGEIHYHQKHGSKFCNNHSMVKFTYFFLGHWTYKAEVIASLKQGEEPWMLEKEVTSPPCPGTWQATSKWKPSQLIPQLVRVTWTPEVTGEELPRGLQRNLAFTPHSSLSQYPFCCTPSLRTLIGVLVKFWNLYCHLKGQKYEWLNWSNNLSVTRMNEWVHAEKCHEKLFFSSFKRDTERVFISSLD